MHSADNGRAVAAGSPRAYEFSRALRQLRFQDSVGYIQRFLADANARMIAGKLDEAVTSIGRALHGIQDFYAHSNYFELMATHFQNSFQAVPTLRT